MAKEEKNAYSVQNDQDIGEIKIADDVVASIAALAASEVDGVASIAGNISNEHGSRFGMKNFCRGVKVDVIEDVVSVSLALNIRHSYNIMEVSVKAQEKVRNAIENMTGLKVADVNIKIAGIETGAAEDHE